MMTTNVTLMTIPDSPVEQVNRDTMKAAVERIRFIIPKGDEMSTAQVTAIAQEAILYRIVPGRDVHYFINRGQLEKVFDYKYLKNFCTFKEQLLSGDDTATLEDTYRPLTDQERAQHNLVDGQIAALCTITTKRERQMFGDEVKRWVELGFNADEAVKLAKEIYGPLGSSAVGVVFKGDTPPKGWSHYQLAEKLAFKNAVNRKYGQPTADEMAAMAHRMAHKAMPEHWQQIDPTLPREAQARLADVEAITEEVLSEAEQMTDDERRANFANNVIIMRGEDEGAIGEDESTFVDEFIADVVKRVPWYDAEKVRQVCNENGWAMDLASVTEDTTETLFDILAKHATAQADAEAE